MKGRGGDLPPLAVIFEPDTVQVLRLVEASASTWETVWLVDLAMGGVAGEIPILRRFGDVVNITGLTPDAIAAAIKPRGVQGIIAFEDAELPRAALIGEALGLPFRSPEATRRLTNKAAQREAFQQAGLPVPRFCVFPANASDGVQRALAETVQFPAILKPLAGTGSRNVFAVPDIGVLLKLLKEWPEAPGGVRADMIAEERIPNGWPRSDRPYADYVTVESLASGGKVSHVAVTGRMPMAEPFRQTGSFISSNLPADTTSDIMDVARRAIEATGACVGAFHTEVKLTPDGPRVVEVNGRVGGGGVPDIIGLLTGHSMFNLAGRVALGEPVHFDAPLTPTEVGFYYRYQPPIDAMRLTRLDGISAVGRLKGIREMFVNRHPGDRVDDWRDGSAGYLFSVLGTSANHEAMWDLVENIRDLVTAEYEPVSERQGQSE